ncbi:hypothetical protein EOA75_22985 [Mesorhizobium sp. M1A.F.Ca.IN.022.07.1.1]|nr:hypothetical protein EOA75_22985 [Mesorhizobium sp. M1A.F.Ca.IN.022.07.1.1]RWG01641.1 MAG: hypothetical protein EOQ54_22580 [Mesorhizobium sp.]RWG97339.1 MAG: hypothetical protein EOQ72_19170 [Mesorhizobium sp.]TIN36629.1 MAG: hypothetical protein E5Y25_23460 [Mesorhizobium sp.]TIR91733.1 MAG: hypothetical protein E5X08_17425 [Mesorhizobium sp.]
MRHEMRSAFYAQGPPLTASRPSPPSRGEITGASRALLPLGNPRHDSRSARLPSPHRAGLCRRHVYLRAQPALRRRGAGAVQPRQRKGLAGRRQGFPHPPAGAKIRADLLRARRAHLLGRLGERRRFRHRRRRSR